MNEALAQMLAGYTSRSLEDHLRALREILQQIALLGLWRSKFFDKAAFYGGTALRILYGLDRYSEDLDFSLLSSTKRFGLSIYSSALKKELAAFGFEVRVEPISKKSLSAVQSAFLKADTMSQLLVVRTPDEIVKRIHRGQVLKIKLEVDTDPPPGFETHTRYVLQPIPFAVRAYVLPDLFAGKMHAILCRRWKRRVKGRDWYDLVWYAANHPELRLAHLEQRLRQSGDWEEGRPLDAATLRERLDQAIGALDVSQARREVAPFVRNPLALEVWSQEFFRDVASRIRIV
jgi:predicted nucleotidyltransferase component of viral defense system